MTDHEPDNSNRDQRLHGEAGLARAYRAAAHEQPPATLDALILAQARDRLEPPHRRGMRWMIPLSVAAVLVLSVSVVLHLSQRGTPGPEEMTSISSVTDRVAQRMDAPAEAKRPAAPAPRAGADAAAKSSRAEPESPRAAALATLDERVGQELRSAEEPAATAITAAKDAAGGADVLAVEASGAPGRYEFTVTLRSPDTGCEQYADWWEVLSADGKLLYRRVLAHSHANEQPFTRGGGPVPVARNTVVWIRAHINNGGYGGAAMMGSVETGFHRGPLASDFAAGVAKEEPLPRGCDF